MTRVARDQLPIDSRTIDVLNLATGRSVLYCGDAHLTPWTAVIAAYAQERGDWNTWEYPLRYEALVERGRGVVACGDWCALEKGTS